MKREVDIIRVTDLIIEGRSLSEAVAIVETKIDAANIEGFLKSPLYSIIGKNCQKMLYKVENANEYRKYRSENARDVVEAELDDLEYSANILQGLSLVNFPESVKAPLTKLVKSAFNGVSRGLKRLTSISDEQIPDFFEPLDYTKRALSTFTDAFKLLNIPWDYDYHWENYLNDTDPEKTKTPATKDSQGKRQVDYKVPECRQRELAFMAISADVDNLENLDSVFEGVDLEDSEREFVFRLWNKFVGKE